MADSQTAASAAPNSALRVSLSQLLLWMLATCIVLAHEQWRLRTGEAQGATFRNYFNFTLLVFAPLKGAGLAGLILWGWRRLRSGQRTPISPGHWLLILPGSVFVANCLDSWLIDAMGHDHYRSMPLWAWWLRFLAWDAFKVLFDVAAAVQFWRDRWWRTTFITFTLGPIAGVLEYAIESAVKGSPWFLNELAWSIGNLILFSVPAFCAIAALISDRRRGVRYDFLHYAGVAVLILSTALAWPRMAVWRYLFR
jgi:hypothetical protein